MGRISFPVLMSCWYRYYRKTGLKAPRHECLILTHILQPEMKSKVNAFKERLQREPAFPNGSPERRDHHGNEKDAPPRCATSVRDPSRWSLWQASVQSAGPPPPASAAQSPREPVALVRNARIHGSATSVRQEGQEGTTDPTSAIRPSTRGPCRSSMRHPLLRH